MALRLGFQHIFLCLLCASLPFTQAQNTARENYDTYRGFQQDADIVRLNHLVYWGKLIEEFKDKTGKYPLSGQSSDPLEVFIATPKQLQLFGEIPNPLKHSRRTMAEFVNELEQGLGRSIAEYYDPQFVPDVKPNFYLYQIQDDTYFFAVHTHQTFGIAKYIAPDYAKVEISNQVLAENAIYRLKDLLSHQAFQTAINQPIQKPGFFEQRAQETLHASKTTLGK